MYSKRLIIITLTALFLNLASLAFCETYYLDAVNGNDSNLGTSNSPWRTVAKAQSVVQPGDKVILANGDYDAFSPPSQVYDGDAGASLADTTIHWITWQAKPGHTPTFNAIYLEREGNKYFLGYWLKGLKFHWLSTKNIVALNIENCEVIGCNDSIETAYGGLSFNFSSNIYVADSKIHFIRDNGVCISNSCHVTVANCDVYDIGVDHFTLRTEQTDCVNIRITGNTIRDTLWWNPSAHPDGIQYYASNGNSFRNCVFAGNKMYNLAVQGFFISGGRFIDGVIENNLVYDCGSGAVNIDDTTDTLFRNNTVLGYCVFATRNSNLAIYNNIIYGTYVLQDLSALGYHDYNIYSQAYTDWVNGSEPHTYRYPQNQLSAMLSELFTNAAGNDYSLRPNCRAVDFCPQSPAAAYDDILQQPRDSKPDAGSYEIMGDTPPPVEEPLDEEPPAEEPPADEPPADEPPADVPPDDDGASNDIPYPRVQKRIDSLNKAMTRTDVRYEFQIERLDDLRNRINDRDMLQERKENRLSKVDTKEERFDLSYERRMELLALKLQQITSSANAGSQ